MTEVVGGRDVGMVDKPVSKTGGFKNREGSSPSRATNESFVVGH